MNCRNEIIQSQKIIPRLFSVIIFVCILSIVGNSECFASTVVLHWEPVNASDLGGYKVYYQADSSAKPFHGTGALQGASPINVFKQPSATISGLDRTRSYYFAVVAYNKSGVESPYSNILAVHPLAVNLSGSGFGTVNSSPSGISCSNGTCSAQFAYGSSLTLYATASSSSTALSYFSGWSGGCKTIKGNSCTVTMNGNKYATATFITRQPVHIDRGSDYSSSDYYSLQSAYGDALNNSNIQAQAVTLTGSFTASSTNTITLKGGYNATYSGRSGYTVMAGTLSVAKGTLVLDNLVIK